MAQVIKSIEVDVPVGVSYNQWTQFESFPQFLEFVDTIEQTSDTMTHWTVSFGGSKHSFDAEITEQHPDERVAWKSVGGEDQAGVVTFHKLSDATSRVTVQLDWKPKGFAEKAASVAGIDGRMIEKSLKDFKAFIEKRGSETGAWRGDVQA